jgi:hypothetical protein
MKVIAYPTQVDPPILRPASAKREWMDTAANKNPYRCLPLSMANSFGWEILSKGRFRAEWNGGRANTDIKVTPLDGTDFPLSHFGEGTITWHLGYIFKTPYPYGIYMMGAPNDPKPNVIALSGVVETHWLPYTATMNWRFTQPGVFEMNIGEPFCQIFPVDMNLFETMEVPEIRSMHEPGAEEDHDLYWDWNLSRAQFMVEQRNGLYTPDVWQRNYFKGTHPKGKVYPDGEGKCPYIKLADGTQKSTHKTKPGAKPFVDKKVDNEFKTPEYYWERNKELELLERKLNARRQMEQPQIIEQPLLNPNDFDKRVRELQEQFRAYHDAQNKSLNNNTNKKKAGKKTTTKKVKTKGEQK